MKKTGLIAIVMFVCFFSAEAGLKHASAEISSADGPVYENSSGISRRIVGGDKVADADAWPWMAALIYPGWGSDYDNQFCGGSLIHPNWILTAAHCVEEDDGRIMSTSDIEVVLGTHDLKYGNGEHFAVKQIIVHPLYGDGNYFTPDSDIALLELETAADSYPTVPVYNGSDTLAGKDSIVIGWGSTRGWGNLYRVADPWILRQVTIPVVSNQECVRAFSAEGYTDKEYTIDSSMLCAGDISGGKDSCQGDSGGPLIVQEDGVWKVAGLVSWGVGRYCAEPGVYGIYTRVSELIDFIDSYANIRSFPAAPAFTLTTSGTDISLSWEPVSGADGYYLCFSPWPDTEPLTEADMGLATSISGPLPPGSAYYAAIKAYNGNVSGNLSNILFFVFVDGASSSSLTIRTEDGAADISWIPPADSVSCRLYHAPYPELSPIEFKEMGTIRQISASALAASSFYTLTEFLNSRGTAQYSNIMGMAEAPELHSR
ncbi:MAG: serine protease [Desulfococcaceae bacterium]